MARRKCSNKRPDTLMQNGSPPARRNHLQRTAGPYIGSQVDSCSAAIRSVIRSPCRRGRLVIVDCQVERHRSLMIEMSGYLVGNCTGRSEGLVPLTTLSTYFVECLKSSSRSGP